MLRVQLAAGELRVTTDGPESLDGLCGFASRQNPKRGFLFVSRVLGKHIPASPAVMRAAQNKLAATLLTQGVTDDALFMGFAETATGLGAGVFESFCRSAKPERALYVQTTRYHFEGRELALDFHEEHSHATGHLLYVPQVEPRVFFEGSTLVLVDDEFSTGKTCLNFLTEFLLINPHVRTIAFVSLLDWMGNARRAEIVQQLEGRRVLFVSALQGSFAFDRDPTFVCPPMPAVTGNDQPKNALIPASFGRFGYTSAQARQFDFAGAAARLALRPGEPLAVLGDGEYLHLPLRFAEFLAEHGHPVTVQSTTRSPILPGHAIARTVHFEDHYADGIQNFLHNPPRPSDVRVVLCHEAIGELHLARELQLTPIAHSEFLCA